MEPFLFALNAVLPIVLLAALGYLLKKISLVDEKFIKTGNKIVFKVLLPVMLFNNVYKIENLGAVEFGYVLYSVLAIIAVFFRRSYNERIYHKGKPEESRAHTGNLPFQLCPHRNTRCRKSFRRRGGNNRFRPFRICHSGFQYPCGGGAFGFRERKVQFKSNPARYYEKSADTRSICRVRRSFYPRNFYHKRNCLPAL